MNEAGAALEGTRGRDCDCVCVCACEAVSTDAGS